MLDKVRERLGSLNLFDSAKLRLVLLNMLVLAAILLGLEFMVWRFFSSNMYSEVDQQLGRQAAQDVASVQRAGGDMYAIMNGTNWDPEYRTLVTNPTGQVDFSTDCPQYMLLHPPCPPDSMMPTSPDALGGARSNGEDMRTVTFRREPERVLTFSVEAGGALLGFVQISRTASGEQTSLTELTQLLLLGGIGAIILSGLGGYFLANRAFIPIREAFKRQRQFTADASHELRTPLALIRANAEMLSRHGDRFPSGDPELVHEIIQETDHLNRLVGDLLTLARADAGSLELAARPVDLRGLVADVHEDLSRIAESRGISSAALLDGPVTVQGDEGRLRQLLLILLDNALKYTDPGGRVDVALHRENGHATLTVSDTGIGIPTKDIPHIFERFYRVDQAREHESGGTGLGLAIARWIVQAHQGNIKVESELGKGTRFLVDLPAN